MGSSRALLDLALQRMPVLRPDEKLLVRGLVDDEASFSVLSIEDIASFIGRRIEGGRWTPAGLLVEAEADARLLARSGAFHVLFDDPRYPALLRETYRAPFGLYFRGKPLSPDRPCAAVVGTRMPTGRGLEAAGELGAGLASAGVPVVSGLARGIDSAAHRGALRAGGPTCAVLPCGIDAVYPSSNRGLAAAILESGGLLLTEYAPGSDIHKYRFPERNRIIAGMARACVVVEAPLGSGALITADHALQEGRDVWVSRPCLGGVRSAGIDRLAAEGAPSLEGPGELLAEWGVESRRRGRGATLGVRATKPFGEGRRLAAALRDELELEAEEDVPTACIGDSRYGGS
jgi:DNA processing protein